MGTRKDRTAERLETMVGATNRPVSQNVELFCPVSPLFQIFGAGTAGFNEDFPLVIRGVRPHGAKDG